MPEAKLLTDSSPADHQSFAGNYFSLSTGFGVTLLTGILYGLFFRANQKQRGKLQGVKCIVIIAFIIVATLGFLKPFLHLSTAGEFSTDREILKEKFEGIPKFTPAFGLALGILAFSTVLSQLTCVPELMVVNRETQRDCSPYREYFKLPLFMANLFAFALKSVFAIAGAMVFSDNSNLFDGLLFSGTPADTVLIALAVYCLFIVLPQAIELQKQAKFFASIASENDAIPCN